jgi:uncharacterized protein YdiU (UPF0061 family)
MIRFRDTSPGPRSRSIRSGRPARPTWYVAGLGPRTRTATARRAYAGRSGGDNRLPRRMCDAAADEKADAEVRALFANPAAYDSWAARWASRMSAERLEPAARGQAMRTINPAFIARNHRVEQVLNAAIEYGDFSPFAELLTVLSRPYEDQAVFADYANPPQADERVFRTFCGT